MNSNDVLKFNSQYDYIIVGGGSAGCVLANRLSQDENNRVLLVEAGGKDNNFWIHLPIGYYKTIYNKNLNWGYQTEPDLNINNRSISWPRGKVLGGSSSINGLIYIRGQKEDYDEWLNTGNIGWGWSDVLPYFKKAENQENGENHYHGNNGPLFVSNLSSPHPICKIYLETAMRFGIPFNDDFNGVNQEGVGYYQLTTNKGLRCSSAVAYLKPVLKRSNLTVILNALVTKVIFENKKAIAVNLIKDERNYFLKAQKEIILSAGAINSPKILLLSGVGPINELEKNGIDVIENIPGVGKNLQDHFQVRIVYESQNIKTLNEESRSFIWKIKSFLTYIFKKNGPFTVGAGQVGVFCSTTENREARPDIQFHFMPFSTELPGKKLHTFSGFTASICQLRPASRGTITINSTEPTQMPIIRPNYLDCELDINTTIGGIKIARKISESTPLNQYITSEIYPGSKVRTKDGLLKYSKNNGNTIFHPCGTCKMGNDYMSVIDCRLKIRGLTGIRVVDASVMPTIISGNINAATIMIAEKASDMILQDNSTD